MWQRDLRQYALTVAASEFGKDVTSEAMQQRLRDVVVQRTLEARMRGEAAAGGAGGLESESAAATAVSLFSEAVPRPVGRLVSMGISMLVSLMQVTIAQSPQASAPLLRSINALVAAQEPQGLRDGAGRLPTVVAESLQVARCTRDIQRVNRL